MKGLVLTLATAGTGLVTGLFGAFSLAVMPGLRHVPDAAFVTTMQRINTAIVNPAFLLLFLGSPLLLAVAVWLGPERRWSGIALALTVASLAVSFAVNIPHNDALAAAGSTDPAAARAAFEHVWTVAHTVRTVLLVGAFGSCLVALQASRAAR